jgi:hypothetical protein
VCCVRILEKYRLDNSNSRRRPVRNALACDATLDQVGAVDVVY